MSNNEDDKLVDASISETHMCYIVHAGANDFNQYMHFDSNHSKYNDCVSDAPATGYFFGPAAYRGLIDVALPPRSKMHLEILGFQVDPGDDCTGKITTGQPLQISTGLHTRPHIKYRGVRIDSPTTANPDGGLYKFYSTPDMVELKEGDNQIVLNALPWNDGWETVQALPPSYACGEEATAIIPFPSRGIPGPVIGLSATPSAAQFKYAFDNAYTAENLTLDSLSMFENSSDSIPGADYFTVECPTGATSMIFLIFDKVGSNFNKVGQGSPVACTDADDRVDGSKRKSASPTFTDGQTTIPTGGNNGDYRIFFAVPSVGATPILEKSRVWKFTKN